MKTRILVLTLLALCAQLACTARGTAPEGPTSLPDEIIQPKYIPAALNDLERDPRVAEFKPITTQQLDPETGQLRSRITIYRVGFKNRKKGLEVIRALDKAWQLDAERSYRTFYTDDTMPQNFRIYTGTTPEQYQDIQRQPGETGRVCNFIDAANPEQRTCYVLMYNQRRLHYAPRDYVVSIYVVTSKRYELWEQERKGSALARQMDTDERQAMVDRVKAMADSSRTTWQQAQAGKGAQMKITTAITDFSRLQVDAPVKVVYTQETPRGTVVKEGPSEMQEQIEMGVQNGQLTIQLKNKQENITTDFYKLPAFTIYVSSTGLERIGLSKMARFETKRLTGHNLEFEAEQMGQAEFGQLTLKGTLTATLSGMGKLSVGQLKAAQTKATVSGMGRLQADRLVTTGRTDLDVSGMSHAELGDLEGGTLAGKASGMSTLTVKGKTGRADFKATGMSKINARGLYWTSGTTDADSTSSIQPARPPLK